MDRFLLHSLELFNIMIIPGATPDPRPQTIRQYDNKEE